jgi:hypothetical protein
MELDRVLPRDAMEFAREWAAQTDDRRGAASWNTFTAYIIMLAAVFLTTVHPRATVRDLLSYVCQSRLPDLLADAAVVAPDLTAPVVGLLRGWQSDALVATVYREVLQRCRCLEPSAAWAR